MRFSRRPRYWSERLPRFLVTDAARLPVHFGGDYSCRMATLAEVEKLALALSEQERGALAAKLIDSLPDANSDADADNAPARFKIVKSSMLHRVRYDRKNKFLDVVFRTGEKYRYKDVPPDEYNGLMNANSLGRYMQTHIIDQYEVEKLEG